MDDLGVLLSLRKPPYMIDMKENRMDKYVRFRYVYCFHLAPTAVTTNVHSDEILAETVKIATMKVSWSKDRNHIHR